MGRGMKAGKKPKTGGMKGGAKAQQQQMAQLAAIQKEMDRVQSEIEQMETSASSGGGVVSVTVNGKKEVTELKLQPEIVDPDDIEMLQDLVMTAINEAMRQMEEISQNEMNKVTGGLGLPEGMF
ncbi:MAG: YbaB/EbfC family nucleoid-associated protein [Anaerovoracaceae bacterium]|jgi:DNA-binding YbaB/EbfC family protein|nr:YbaB/EbfC family nucleoid-associated protein [Anaerovoracaceae bacterium]